jgi:hypothetical protein
LAARAAIAGHGAIKSAATASAGAAVSTIWRGSRAARTALSREKQVSAGATLAAATRAAAAAAATIDSAATAAIGSRCARIASTTPAENQTAAIAAFGARDRCRCHNYDQR